MFLRSQAGGSPVLFSVFINDSANEIMQRGRHGIQLIPDLIEIFNLLFADNVILVSDTECGLQNQLNVLSDTANRLSLFVSMEKYIKKCISKWRTYSPA